MKKPLPLLILFWGFLLLPRLSGQTGPDTSAVVVDTTGSILQYFQSFSDSLPLIRIETGWGRLVRTKMAEQYQDATWSFAGPGGEPVELSVKMRARGNMRKQVCYFPPVKVKFRKADLKQLNFNLMNEIKMVFPCRGGKRDGDYLLREALIYRFYELISPVYLQTRLVRLEGWEKDKQKLEGYGLLIEHDEELAARLNARVLERGMVNISGLDRDIYLRMTFFEYMILNTDWSIPYRHNISFVSMEEYPNIVPIPYDFDYAGLVDAPYAVPADVLPIKSVREPFYLGYKVTKEEALRTARYFLERKEAILACCEDFTFLEEKSRASVCKEIEAFFELLEDEKKMLRVFVTGE